MNPEDRVIDAIAALVDEAIARGPTDDYERDWLARCEDCLHDWHGLRCECGCPGGHADDKTRTAYRAARDAQRALSASYDPSELAVDWAAWGVGASGHAWTLATLQQLRGQMWVHRGRPLRCHQCQRYLGDDVPDDAPPAEWCDECAAMRRQADARAGRQALAWIFNEPPHPTSESENP